MAKRITLIHATAVSIQPIENAFIAAWPEAERVNLLEDSLSTDRARDGELTESMCKRFEALSDYAAGIGSDAILFTCSAFAGAIEKVQKKLTIPVLKPNEAMLEAALDKGPRVLLVATFPATIDSMTPELHTLAQTRGLALELNTCLVDAAMPALAAGNAERHDRLILEALSETPLVDVIILAQFSMSRVHSQLVGKVNAPVLTAPDTAVQKLSRLIR